MKPHVEAWARYCATHKYSVRMTIAQAIARTRAVLSVATWGPKCEVCGGLLQVGYKVMIPDQHIARSWSISYIHTSPEWCAYTHRDTALFKVVEDAFASVDRELQGGAQFDNVLLVISSRIALAWLDLEKV